MLEVDRVARAKLPGCVTSATHVLAPSLASSRGWQSNVHGWQKTPCGLLRGSPISGCHGAHLAMMGHTLPCVIRVSQPHSNGSWAALNGLQAITCTETAGDVASAAL